MASGEAGRGRGGEDHIRKRRGKKTRSEDDNCRNGSDATMRLGMEKMFPLSHARARPDKIRCREIIDSARKRGRSLSPVERL